MTTGYLRHLAHFVVAVDTGSVTAAANRLGLSPSAISDSLRVLEAHFGEPLVERSRKGIRPLPRGTRLFDEAGPIVTALERSLDRGDASDAAGEVRATLPSELAVLWFGPVWARLAREVPDLRLVLHCEDQPQDYGKFTRDLVVRVSGVTTFAGLNVLHQIEVQTALVAHPDLVPLDKATDPDAICAQVLITGLGASGPVTRLQDGEVLEFAGQVQLEAIDARIGLMRMGGGVMGCLRPTVAEDIAAGRLVSLMPGRFDYRTTVTVGTPHKRPAARITRVADAMADRITALAAR